MVFKIKSLRETPLKKYKNTAPIKTERPGDISVIILAAGEGTRMKTVGPKALIDVSPIQTLIGRQLELVSNVLHPKETVLVVGHEAQKVMAKTPNNIIKIENENYATTNVVRSLGMGLRAVSTDYVVVILGDLVFTSHALTFPLSHSTLVLDNGTMGEEEIGVTVCDDEVEHLYYDLPQKWAQVSLFMGKELRLLKNIAWNVDKNKWYLFEAINEIISKGGRFLSYKNNNLRVADMDSIKDLEKIKTIV